MQEIGLRIEYLGALVMSTPHTVANDLSIARKLAELEGYLSGLERTRSAIMPVGGLVAGTARQGGTARCDEGSWLLQPLSHSLAGLRGSRAWATSARRAHRADTAEVQARHTSHSNITSLLALGRIDAMRNLLKS
jgi:hypothetical protein